MRVLSRKDLHSITERIIEEYKQLPENRGKVLRSIDPLLLLRNQLGLTIDYKHLSVDGSILGLTSYANVGVEIFDDEEEAYLLDGRTVLIERDIAFNPEMRGRRNFTLMHEGGHQILKMLFPNDYGLKYRQSPVHYYKPTDSAKNMVLDWGEWQANTLASYLMLPTECIERALFMFGLGDKIKLLNRVYAPTEYDRFSDMAVFLPRHPTQGMKAMHLRDITRLQ